MLVRYPALSSVVALAAVLGVLIRIDSAAPAQTASGARVVAAVRAYGDGPVVLGPGVDRARVRFAGKKGDRVTVRDRYLCPSVLRGPGGSVLRRAPSKFWRLPARATYTISYDRCPNARGQVIRLQLIKLVVHRLVVDGAPLRVSHRTGYVQAAAVQVPATGRVQVTPYAAERPFTWPDLILPDGRRHRRGSPHFVPADLALESGIPVSAQDGPLPGLEDRPLHPGDRVLVLAWGSLRILASTPAVRPVTLDGPAVVAGNGGVPFRETQLEFDGQAGQWVHLELVGDLGLADAYERYHLLIDPTGQVLTRSETPYHPYWQLPVTGRYRLMVEAGKKPAQATVRVRTIRQLAESMPTDATPLTFTATEPGEWVLTTFAIAVGLQYRLHVSSTSTTGDWEAFAEPTARFLCDYGGPMGCGDYTYGWVDPGLPDSYPMGGYKPGSWVVVLAMAPGQSGDVTLSLKGEPYPRIPFGALSGPARR